MADQSDSIVVQIAHTARDHRRSLRSSRRRVLWRIRVVGAVILVAGAALLALGEEFLFLIGVAFFVWGAALFARSFLLPGAIVRRLPPESFARHELEIGPAGIRMGSNTVSTIYAWGGFSSARRAGDLWVLQRTTGGRPVNIGRGDFTPEQQERIDALLREHGLLA